MGRQQLGLRPAQGSVIKPGQVLRLGQIEMRLETDAPPGPPKKPVEQTMVIPRGVSLNEREQSTGASGFDTKGTGFTKKDNKGNKIFIGIMVVMFLVIAVLLGIFFLK